MAREIEFRAKDLYGKWVYGFYSPRIWFPSLEQTPNIKTFTGSDIEIDVKTLGQYTGLKDKNGTKIFEGDVVKFFGMIGKVISQCGSFGICFDDCVDYEKFDKFTQKRVGNNFSGVCCDNFISIYEIWWNLNNLDDYLYEVEIIGNIYDNPRLLEKK